MEIGLIAADLLFSPKSTISDTSPSVLSSPQILAHSPVGSVGSYREPGLLSGRS